MLINHSSKNNNVEVCVVYSSIIPRLEVIALQDIFLSLPTLPPLLLCFLMFLYIYYYYFFDRRRYSLKGDPLFLLFFFLFSIFYSSLSIIFKFLFFLLFSISFFLFYSILFYFFYEKKILTREINYS